MQEEEVPKNLAKRYASPPTLDGVNPSAEGVLKRASMDQAQVLITADDELQRGKSEAVTLAVARECDGIDGIDIQEGWCPILYLGNHLIHVFLVPQERVT